MRPTWSVRLRWLAFVVPAVLLAACGTPTSLGAASNSTVPNNTTTTTPSAYLSLSHSQSLSTPAALDAVSCTSPTFCVAVDSVGRSFSFNGSVWSGMQPAMPQSIGPGAISVSCFWADQCAAITTASDQIVNGNGIAWGPPITIGGSTGLGAIGCAQSGYCMAIDAFGNSFATTGNGFWYRTSGDWGSAKAVVCVSADFCASASGGLSIWNGTSWTRPNSYASTSSFTGVTCPTVNFCAAVDQDGQVLVWNGTSWSAPIEIEPGSFSSISLLNSPTDISCPTTSFCAAVDSAGNLLEWHGAGWVSRPVDRGRRLTGISCVSSTFCAAIDSTGHVFTP